jgi:hypothetical protein
MLLQTCLLSRWTLPLNLAFYIYAVPGVFVMFFCFECVLHILEQL